MGRTIAGVTLASLLISMCIGMSSPAYASAPPPRSLSSGEASANSEGLYELLDGEVGVENPNYPYDDCRRYGVFPDGITTDWEKQVQCCEVNSAHFGIPIHFPAGLYKTGLNIEESNVTFVMDEGAEWGGVVHIYNENETIHNTKIYGCVTTYARFGIINSVDTYIEKIHTKVDQGKLPPKASTGRGVHLYWGVCNFSCEEILVDDFLAAAPNNDAAVSIDGEGANPSNVSISSIVVSNSEVNGVYVTGSGHRFGKVSIENYGTDSYQGHGVQDANGLAQSKELKGIWINKCANTSFSEIAVNSKGSYPNAKYALLIEETGSFNDGPILVGNLQVTGFDFSNGPALCFGDPRFPSSNCTCIIVACDIESMPVNSAHWDWGFAMYSQPYAYAYIGAFDSDNIDISCKIEDRGWWAMPTRSVQFPYCFDSQYPEYFVAYSS